MQISAATDSTFTVKESHRLAVAVSTKPIASLMALDAILSN
jgi:hypothetical protein